MIQATQTASLNLDATPNDCPLISCLCVTDNRAPFMPWLLWCYERQSYPGRELVIVDSSREPFDPGDRADVRVVGMPQGTSIGSKRNRAIAEARGEIITWFDDDDWQHPDKCARLVEALHNGAAVAGAREGWFVDLFEGRCLRHGNPGGNVLFNSAAFRKTAVQNHLFRTDVRKASDTTWMSGLNQHHAKKPVIIAEVLFFWLCHQQNISNPATKRHFTDSLDRLRETIGKEAWGETDQRLVELTERLPRLPKTERNVTVRGGEFGCRSNGRLVQPREPDRRPASVITKDSSVTVVIKATLLDVPYLKVMVRHMIAQAHFKFAERIIVVDRPRSFAGKYAARAQFSEEALEKVLEELLQEELIDRICRVDYRDAVVTQTMERYFGRTARRVPTHASTGGPIYATLFGMESARTDLVLPMDADVFFHSNGSSWVEQALERMAADSRLQLMMTHPGPPAGSPGRSIRTHNTRIANWDADLCLWRFRHATTRYFLCDRRNLHGRLQPIWLSTQCAPLEQCISRMLQRENVFRGALGDLQSWHLHAWYHGDPFPAWAANLARAVERGHFPKQQAGNYDLRLDLPTDRCAWRRIIQNFDPRPVSEVVDRAPEGIDLSGTATAVAGNGNGSPAVAPIAVIIPVRNRGGARLRRALESLHWQSSGVPAAVMIVSHGSSTDANLELGKLCADFNAELITVGKPNEAWNKSFALNVGIRKSPLNVAYLMTMDADMILSPNFLRVVTDTLASRPSSFVLCRSADLAEGTALPDSSALKPSLGRLKAAARLRPRYGTGGIQAARRSFFFEARGYDEDLLWWGAMDGDMVGRARLAGLRPVWIEDQAFMLHQWHPKKFRALTGAEESIAAQHAWKRNHEIVTKRARALERNSEAWGIRDDVIAIEESLEPAAAQL